MCTIKPFSMVYNGYMRLAIAIFICKFCRKVLKHFGRGSSMPGKIALMFYKNALAKVKTPELVIAVTGTNGKTSTVEMINQVLTAAGKNVAYNSESSNELDGVATLVLSNCSYKGEFLSDVLLMEVDERYAKYVTKYIKPTYYLITNIFRDQMTRNGNPEFVLSEIKKSIYPESTLILNADDPMSSSLATKDSKVYYYGINDAHDSKKGNKFIYDDGYYCPICKNKMVYDYNVVGSIGKFHCTSCDFSRKKPSTYISELNLKDNYVIINERNRIDLAFNSIFNAYNVLAAFALGKIVGIKPQAICDCLNDYLVRNGRVKRFKLRFNRGTLLISKHENSVSYNENIKYIINQKKDCTVFIMVDAISRRYFTSETSWLWDISFDWLNDKHIKNIVLTGTYACDLAVRFSYTNIDFSKIYVNSNIKEAIDYTASLNRYAYVLTCFSDEKKFTSEVNAVW